LFIFPRSLLFSYREVAQAERPKEAKLQRGYLMMRNTTREQPAGERKGSPLITLFLCGDVMTGRGIDQVLPHPSDPVLYEPYIRDARQYVELAEQMNGRLPRSVEFSYIWGDALERLDKLAPDLRLINLETSVTESRSYWKGKAIHYKMHPKNISCLTAARIDFCALANNHVLDWGYSGLTETLKRLQGANVKSAGAGAKLDEAEAPAVLHVNGKGRVLVFSFASETSGVPWEWAASEKKPGVNLLEDFTDETVRRIGEKVLRVKQQGDIVVASIHWGSNWGYEISRQERNFAHNLIDRAAIDVIHGHSSHHPKGVEVHAGKPMLYGCGDFLNDYEGISGYENFRADLGLMYLVSMNPTSEELVRLRMIPTQIRHFKVNRASNADSMWLRDRLDRECRKLGGRVELTEDGELTLERSD
jgi:poly-gamma-glutamate capsule biosynthesis protein CapA/YwtB (metallophosphatase superfamily)